MGNSESSDSQFPPPEDDGNNRRFNRDRAKKPATEEAEPSSTVKMCAAVAGTALLALGAWSLASSSSSEDSDDRRIARMEKLEPKLGRDGGGYIPGDHVFESCRNRKPPYFYQPRHTDVLKILSYNVSCKDLEVEKRMEAIGDLIQHHLPDIICFQEITPDIFKIFQNSAWWKAYKCSVSQDMATQRNFFCMQMSKLPRKATFSCIPLTGNSVVNKELCSAHIDVGLEEELVVATSHLKRPYNNRKYIPERIAQAEQCLGHLEDLQNVNVIFGGDMNWDDECDGSFPLSDGWVDAWTEVRPGENGWTYDCEANQMLWGNSEAVQKRLDRFVCNLRDFKISSIEMIGTEAVPGLYYCKEEAELPVLPSDHYGLLLTICRN